MKHFFLGIFLITISLTGFGQDCQYEVNTVDKFTGDTVKELKLIKIASKIKKDKHYTLKNVKCAFKKKGGTYQIIVYFVLKASSKSITFFNTTEANLLLNEGTKITVTSVNLPDIIGTSSGLSYKFMFNISESDFKTLKLNTITDIRIIPALNNEPMDIAIESEKAIKIKELADCL